MTALPRIIVRPPKVEVFRQMIASLAGAKEMYRRSGLIVQVEREEGRYPEGIERPPGAPTIREIGDASLAIEVSRYANYVRVTKVLEDGTEMMVSCHPPQWGLDAMKEKSGSLPLPSLTGVVESPVMLADGRILDKPGYDEYSGLIYQPPRKAKFRPVDARPTAADIQVAVTWLKEAVFDFPFEKPAHRSAWMAGVLTYFSRFMYRGPTPLFLIDGNVRGVGKGKLFGAAAQICLGRKPMVAQQSAEDGDDKELLTAICLSGELMAVIDNINRPFGSGPLDSVIAEGVWNPVLKYHDEVTRFDWRAILWANGNNVQWHKVSDTIRRTLKIRVESTLERPEQRTDFKRPEPIYSQWLRENRPSLVWAALTILRGFFQAGSPNGGISAWGSFEKWSAIVRSALVWAGEPDPYEAAAVHEKAGDANAEALGDLLRGWKALCEEMTQESLTAQEAMTALREHIEYTREQSGRSNPHEALIAALCELSPPRSGRLPEPGKLGYALRLAKKRVIGGLYLEPIQRRDHNNRTAWAVRADR